MKNKNHRPIISINPMKEKIYEFDSIFTTKSLSNLNKNSGFYISYIEHKDVIISQININSLTVNLDEIDAIITQKAYEELDLDPNSEYTIKYIKQKDSDTSYTVFIVNNQNILNLYQNTIEKVNYIDCITIAPLLMESLYSENILSGSQTDCFIYFDENDAFLTIYNQGKYILSRSLARQSLGQINSKLCEMTGDKVQIADFLDELKTKGINTEQKDALNQVFDDAFYYVSDIINSVSKFQGLFIQNIYVTSCVGNIPGLAKFIQDRILINTSDFNFFNNIKSSNLDPSCLHILMTLYAKDYISSKIKLNFSPFLRPPIIYQRDGGIFLLIALSTLILSLSYPTYQLISGIYHTKLINDQNILISEQEIIVNNLENKLSKINYDIQVTKQSIYDQDQQLGLKKSLLNQIYSKKQDYPVKSIALYELSKELNALGVKTTNIKINDKTALINLVSNDDKKITQLITNIENLKSYKVSTKQIALTSNAQYDSNITVEIR
ncbi:hypothetical protein BVH35_007865 [Campylobacter fetus]|uniref:hypothetical protein n=1 Tax=Campylobacter fetus TaxID=196 RepID=UPI000818B84D|nr:hypothetical protein [Campylobacter fetus]MPB73100.1 hypothetical protein [Campylobacter fetus]MPB77015.1 hypothetical protein [Campylobacter fetus]OCR96399.1 hypothetical protein CFT12S02847_04480 [Campylobacter fetus subsp. testudinum]OCS03037.1 hypothetical protein CFTCF782_05700 [Campylobacter fetus subsp. testudinum]